MYHLTMTREEKLSINQVVAEKTKKEEKILLEKYSIHEQKHKELETREKTIQKTGLLQSDGQQSLDEREQKLDEREKAQHATFKQQKHEI